MKQLLPLVKRILLIILIFLSCISYLPRFYTSEGVQIGVFKNGIMLISALVFVLSLFNRKLYGNKYLHTYIFLFFCVVALTLMYVGSGLNASLNEIRELAIPLMALVIGLSLEPNRKFLKALFVVFILSSVYVGFRQIMTHLGGFVINSQYLTDSKNSIGGMLGVASTIGMMMALDVENRKPFRIFMLILAFVLLVENLTIRARSAVVAQLLIVFYLFYKYTREHKVKSSTVVLTLLALAIIAVLLPSSFYHFFYDSFFKGKTEDFLSDRGDRVEKALGILYANPFFGNLKEGIHVAWVHNYFLLKAYSFGLLGGLPWLVLYLYIIVKQVKYSLKVKTIRMDNFGFFLLFIPLFISLAEPTFPYGPGTINFLPFMMLGYSMSVMKPEVRKKVSVHNFEKQR